MNRNFEVKLVTVRDEGEWVPMECAFSVGVADAARMVIQIYEPEYVFTGHMRNEGPNLWRGEAYNSTHGLVVWVKEN